MANSVRKLRESIFLTELWSLKKTQGSLSIVYKLNLTNMNHHGLKLTVKFCCASGIAQIIEKQQEKNYTRAIFVYNKDVHRWGCAKGTTTGADISWLKKMIKLPLEGGFAKPPKTRHNSKENRKTASKPHCTFKNRPNGGLPQGSKFSRKPAYKNRPIGGKPPNLATLF